MRIKRISVIISLHIFFRGTLILWLIICLFKLMIFLDEIFIFVYISKFLIKLKLTLNTLWKYSYYSRSMCKHFARTHYAFDDFTSIYFNYILLVLINNLFWSDHCHLRWGGGRGNRRELCWKCMCTHLLTWHCAERHF